MRWSFAKSNLPWYAYGWAMLPLALAGPVGGLLGGLCGGAASALNIYIFQRGLRPVWKYVITGIVSVSTICSFLIVAKILTIALFTSASVDRDLQEFSAYAALKKADPDTYSKLVDQVVLATGQRKPQTQIQAIVSGALDAAVARYTSHASDQAIIDRVRALTLLLDQVGAKNADACFNYLFPKPGEAVDIRTYITPEVATLNQASIVAVLESGASDPQPIPAKEQVSGSLTLVKSRLVAQFGEDDVAMLSQTATADHAKTCRMISAFYKEALSLPRKQAVPVLRFILAQRSST